MFILIDTAKLGLADLAARVADFAAILRASPPSDPDVPVRLPGEAEFARMRRQRNEGLQIDAKVLDFLEQAAARVAV